MYKVKVMNRFLIFIHINAAKNGKQKSEEKLGDRCLGEINLYYINNERVSKIENEQMLMDLAIHVSLPCTYYIHKLCKYTIFYTHIAEYTLH